MTVSGNEIKKHLHNILEHCCVYHNDGSWNGGMEMSGQQFTDALGGFNVVGSYADCKESKVCAAGALINPPSHSSRLRE